MLGHSVSRRNRKTNLLSLPDTLGGAFSIFDLRGNNVLVTVRWSDLEKDISPTPGHSTAHIIKFYTDGSELFAGIVLVDMHSWQVIQHPGYLCQIDLETGKTFKAAFDEKKHAEFVIDYSNLDMSNDCECAKRADKLFTLPSEV